MIHTAIVVAAGAGERMGAGVPKALIEVGGRPMVRWSVDALALSPEVSGVLVIAPPGHEGDVARAVDGIDAVQAIIPGGTTRSRSVACGLRAVPETADAVLVHDAARPLVTPELVSRLLDALGGVDGAIAAAPLVDTVKRQGDDGLIARTVDRAALWLAQTPQVFLRAVIEGAFGGATDADLDAATDCSWLVERSGGRVALVDPGSPNIKVTTPADLVVVEALLRARLPGP